MCLSNLSGETDVNELELIEAKTILGSSGYITPDFENTEILYYLFVLKEDGKRLYVQCIDERLNIVFSHSMALHPMDKST